MTSPFPYLVLGFIFDQGTPSAHEGLERHSSFASSEGLERHSRTLAMRPVKAARLFTSWGLSSVEAIDEVAVNDPMAVSRCKLLVFATGQPLFEHVGYSRWLTLSDWRVTRVITWLFFASNMNWSLLTQF